MSTLTPEAQHKKKQDLFQRAIHGAKWNYFGNIARVICQLLIGIALARILGPQAFGLVAIAWIIISLGKLFSDMGLSAALIQKEHITQSDINFTFTAQLALGLLLTSITLIASQDIALFFNREDSTTIIQAISATFAIQSFGQTGTALLTRELKFKSVQSIGLASYLIGYLAIGIPFALNGMGAWSLVSAQLIQSLTNSAGIIIAADTSYRINFKPQDLNLINFGRKVIFANITSWSLINLDSILVGKFFSSLELGLYNRANNLLSSPIGAIVSATQGVLFSSASKLQKDPENLKKIYFSATALIATVVMPICIAAALVSDTVILAIYGEQWKAAAAILTPLSLSLAIQAILCMAGPILMATGNVHHELRAQIFTLIISIPILVFAAQKTTEMVGWGIFTISVIRWLLLTASINKIFKIKFSDLFSSTLLPIVCAILTASAARITDILMAPTSTQRPTILALEIAIAAVSLLLSLKIFGRYIFVYSGHARLEKQGGIIRFLSKWLNLKISTEGK